MSPFLILVSVSEPEPNNKDPRSFTEHRVNLNSGMNSDISAFIDL